MNTQTQYEDIERLSLDDAGYTLTENEKDTLGEIGNICMGTSATTLSTLLGKRVTITTPRVTTSRGNEYLDEYEKPVVLVEVTYTKGLNGGNTFLVKKEDALIITNLLMGGDGTGINEEEKEEFYLSALSEVMNQMVGTSSTSLASALHVNVNISPPVIRELAKEEKEARKRSDEVSIVISFRMEIEGLLVSNIMQIIPYAFGKQLVEKLHSIEGSTEKHEPPKQAGGGTVVDKKNADGFSYGETVTKTKNESRGVDLKEVKFQSFDDERTTSGYGNGNLDLIIDVPLQVTVVLGKSKKSIKEILDLGMGSVIVLDRLAGDMVDVLVNGKVFARGEVVVINDNYGVRITEISGSAPAKV